jgi:hypothetical protein
MEEEKRFELRLELIRIIYSLVTWNKQDQTTRCTQRLGTLRTKRLASPLTISPSLFALESPPQLLCCDYLIRCFFLPTRLAPVLAIVKFLAAIKAAVLYRKFFILTDRIVSCDHSGPAGECLLKHFDHQHGR